MQARLVGGAHRLDLLAQGADLGRGIGTGRAGHGEGEREARRQKLAHESVTPEGTSERPRRVRRAGAPSSGSAE